jgi:hypothetical protein
MPRANDRRPRTASIAKPRTGTKRGKPRPGLPDKSSILSIKTLTSPKGNRYRIIETDETDAYDLPVAATRKADQ